MENSEIESLIKDRNSLLTDNIFLSKEFGIELYRSRKVNEKGRSRALRRSREFRLSQKFTKKKIYGHNIPLVNTKENLRDAVEDEVKSMTKELLDITNSDELVSIIKHDGWFLTGTHGIIINFLAQRNHRFKVPNKTFKVNIGGNECGIIPDLIDSESKTVVEIWFGNKLGWERLSKTELWKSIGYKCINILMGNSRVLVSD